MSPNSMYFQTQPINEDLEKETLNGANHYISTFKNFQQNNFIRNVDKKQEFIIDPNQHFQENDNIDFGSITTFLANNQLNTTQLQDIMSNRNFKASQNTKLISQQNHEENKVSELENFLNHNLKKLNQHSKFFLI